MRLPHRSGTRKRSQGVKYLAEASGDFEPGSHRKILRNKLGLVRVRDLEDAELLGYHEAEELLISKLTADHRFTVNDIDEIHRLFLGRIYDWAGRHRDVNLSKGGFPFASARAIPSALNEFEQNVLSAYTPCRPGNTEAIAHAIAIVHVELLLIHPYREGNGRTARLLATLMAYQAGLPGLNFGFIGSRGKTFDEYVRAIQAGVKRNYGPMTKIVLEAIRRALRMRA
jgi:cell filamentation protein